MQDLRDLLDKDKESMEEARQLYIRALDQMESFGQADISESVRGDESMFMLASQNNTDWELYQNRLDKLKQGAADRRAEWRALESESQRLRARVSQHEREERELWSRLMLSELAVRKLQEGCDINVRNCQAQSIFANRLAGPPLGELFAIELHGGNELTINGFPLDWPGSSDVRSEAAWGQAAKLLVSARNALLSENLRQQLRFDILPLNYCPRIVTRSSGSSQPRSCHVLGWSQGSPEGFPAAVIAFAQATHEVVLLVQKQHPGTCSDISSARLLPRITALPEQWPRLRHALGASLLLLIAIDAPTFSPP